MEGGGLGLENVGVRGGDKAASRAADDSTYSFKHTASMIVPKSTGIIKLLSNRN